MTQLRLLCRQKLRLQLMQAQVLRQVLFLKHLWHILRRDKYQKVNQTFKLLLKVGAAIQGLNFLG